MSLAFAGAGRPTVALFLLVGGDEVHGRGLLVGGGVEVGAGERVDGLLVDGACCLAGIAGDCSGPAVAIRARHRACRDVRGWS
jgi:hypothetical protein